LNDSAERVRSCDKFKINTAVSLMAGFPEETMTDLRDTAAFFVDSLRYDHADPQLSILAPLADTPIQKQHKDSLVLNDDVADMSYRGWPQEFADHAMITAHPEIFSSFYSVPMPHLEREFLKELRDFLLSGQRAFRRLLLGLHQDSGSVVEVFQQWREWRTKNGVQFSNGDRTAYYAQSSFPADFLRFVRLHYIPTLCQAPLAITALAEYEAALLGHNRESDEADAMSGEEVQFFDDLLSADMEELLSQDSRPQLLPSVNVIKIPADYQEIVRRLRQKKSLHDIPERPVKLAVRRPPQGQAEIRQLTPLSAELLDLCDGNLTVDDITAEFRKRKIELSGVPSDKLCLAGIEILRQQRLIGLA
jgi:hypothetical protein